MHALLAKIVAQATYKGLTSFKKGLGSVVESCKVRFL